MAEHISYVRVEWLEAHGRASAPFLTCLPERAISSNQWLTAQLKKSDPKHLHVITNCLFIALPVLNPSSRHLTFSTG